MPSETKGEDDIMFTPEITLNLPPPPFFTRRLGKPRLASPKIKCKFCGEPLIEISINSHRIHTCDNYRCYLFRERQGIYPNEPKLPDIAAHWNPPHNLNYYEYQEQKQKNYRLLRDVGIPASEARNLTSNKQTRLVLERMANTVLIPPNKKVSKN
jgi:hypothetical protein